VLRRPIGVGIAALAWIFACGNDRPPLEGAGKAPAVSSAGGTTLFDVDGGGAPPPGCGVKDDGTACECADVPLFVDAPTMYFVLDRSGSMSEDGKYNSVRGTVANVLRALGPRANFGVTLFPGADAVANQCASGSEVMGVTPGDPPSSTDGPAVKRFLSATAFVPGGGTPTAVTLSDVANRIGRLTGRKFVILATDGAPNCDSFATCNYDQCQANIENAFDPYTNTQCSATGPANCCDGDPEGCNDAQPTLRAIAQLQGEGIPVYVIGLPGTQQPVYAALLDQMAQAGGTALPTSPRYFKVDSASADVMLTTFKKIAAKIAGTCSYTLQNVPADPNLVNVYMDDIIQPKDPNNGWTISGATVTLVGQSCAQVQDGNVLSVRIIAGCPTVLPK
jgi:hypothetical protein